MTSRTAFGHHILEEQGLLVSPTNNSPSHRATESGNTGDLERRTVVPNGVVRTVLYRPVRTRRHETPPERETLRLSEIPRDAGIRSRTRGWSNSTPRSSPGKRIPTAPRSGGLTSRGSSTRRWTPTCGRSRKATPRPRPARSRTHQANFDFYNHGWTEMMEFPVDELEAHYDRYREFFDRWDVTIDEPLGQFAPPEAFPKRPRRPNASRIPSTPRRERFRRRRLRRDG